MTCIKKAAFSPPFLHIYTYYFFLLKKRKVHAIVISRNINGGPLCSLYVMLRWVTFIAITFLTQKSNRYLCCILKELFML